jgi:predicted outer membrane repeat protein
MAENYADVTDGGAIYTGGSLNIQRSTLAENSAEGLGGAVFQIGNAGFASGNTTYSGNSAWCGGGIALSIGLTSGSDILIGTSTLIDNNSIFDDCSEHIYGSWNSFGLYNSIIASDPLAGPYSDYCSGALTDGNYNLIDEPSCDNGGVTFNLDAISNIDFNLANNGGISRTHNLLVGSNAIDAGLNQACLNPWTGNQMILDQRASPRPVDNNGDGIAECDIGAIELQ